MSARVGLIQLKKFQPKADQPVAVWKKVEDHASGV
jgi:hypothetical protein